MPVTAHYCTTPEGSAKMVAKKKKSKRMGLKDQYKIKKKVKEHHRKLQKMAKEQPHLIKKTKKDPGIPNLWPFKEALLKNIDDQKLQEETLKQEAKARRQKLRECDGKTLVFFLMKLW